MTTSFILSLQHPFNKYVFVQSVCNRVWCHTLSEAFRLSQVYVARASVDVRSKVTHGALVLTTVRDLLTNVFLGELVNCKLTRESPCKQARVRTDRAETEFIFPHTHM